MDRVLFKHLSGSRKADYDAFAAADLDTLLIGRDPSAHVRLDSNHDDVVGRRHAMVQRDAAEPDRLFLADLGSRNGTYLNGRRVRERVELSPGDVLQFGLGGPTCEFDVEPRPRQAVPETAIARQTTTRLGPGEYGWPAPAPVLDIAVRRPRTRRLAATIGLAGLLCAAMTLAAVRPWRGGQEGAQRETPVTAERPLTAAADQADDGATTGVRATQADARPVASDPPGATPPAAAREARETQPDGKPRPRAPRAAPAVAEPIVTARETTPQDRAPAGSTTEQPDDRVHGGVPPAPAADARGDRTANGAAGTAFETFDEVSLVRVAQDRTFESDVKLRFEAGRMVLADPRHGAVLRVIPYGSIQEAAYSASKHPRWRGSTTSAAGAVIGLTGQLFKSTKHWLNLRTSDGEVILRLDKDNFEDVCAALTRRSGTTVAWLAEEK